MKSFGPDCLVLCIDFDGLKFRLLIVVFFIFLNPLSYCLHFDGGLNSHARSIVYEKHFIGLMIAFYGCKYCG